MENIEYKCKFCNRLCKNGNSLRNHERLCKMNPNHQTTKCNFTKEGRAWSKGLTKETDERIKRQNESYIKNGSNNGWTGKHHSRETILKMKKNCGGLRKGSGHGKMGWYKGFYCRSSWELAWIIYQLEHNVKVEQCKEYFEYQYDNETHRYYPDFKIGEVYYEIKGQHFPNLNAKLEQFPKDKKLVMIDGIKANKPFLDYAISKYGKDFIKLYE